MSDLPTTLGFVTKTNEKCTCAKPVLQERSEQKGSSESWCARCKRPLSLRPGGFRNAFH